MKRGLSPLISTVILIALVVVVFVITGSWFRQFSDEILRFTGKESAKQITCSSPGVFLEVDTACYNRDEAILVLGAGKLKFEKFIIALSANEDVTLDTTSGLDQFKIKRFELSTASQDLTDESKEKLEDIDFTLTQQIKVVPQIINENELAVCQNLIKTKTDIECCKGGNACGCSSDSDCSPPNDICDQNNGLCVECLSDSTCPSDRPHCDNNICVECTENSQCTSGQCVNNQCVQQANCNDLKINFNSGASWMDGEIIDLEVASLDYVTEYELRLSDGTNDLLIKSGNRNAEIFKFCYGNGQDARGNQNIRRETCQSPDFFISDKKVTKIIAIVTNTVDEYQHCIGNINPFELDIGCKVSFEQQNCIEQDCGFNRFIPTTGSFGKDPIEDTCDQQDRIKEWYCDSSDARFTTASCTAAGATRCSVNKCINVP